MITNCFALIYYNQDLSIIQKKYIISPFIIIIHLFRLNIIIRTHQFCLKHLIQPFSPP